jgi:hypothetical protein
MNIGQQERLLRLLIRESLLNEMNRMQVETKDEMSDSDESKAEEEELEEFDFAMALSVVDVIKGMM